MKKSTEKWNEYRELIPIGWTEGQIATKIITKSFLNPDEVDPKLFHWACLHQGSNVLVFTEEGCDCFELIASRL